MAMRGVGYNRVTVRFVGQGSGQGQDQAKARGRGRATIIVTWREGSQPRGPSATRSPRLG